MKKIILAIMLISGCLVADDVKTSEKYDTFDALNDTLDLVLSFDEINIKVFSYVKHHFNVDGLSWNEGFKNSAKGIEGIHYLDENHGMGLTYITFRNSFDVRTSAGGFVYKYTTDEIVKDFRSNIKLYALYQKGYYGTWDNPLPYDTKTDDTFYTPLLSVGFDYKNFVIDIVGTHEMLHAATLGYSFKFNLVQ